MYLSHSAIIDHLIKTDTVQNFFGGLKESMCINILGRLDPFGFENSPQCLCNIEIGRIRGKIKNVEPALPPDVNGFFHSASGMDACIVKDNERRTGDCHGEAVDELRHILSLYALTTCNPVIDILTTDHTEYIEPCGFHGRHIDILFGELPAIRHITLCAYMAFVSEEQVY